MSLIVLVILLASVCLCGCGYNKQIFDLDYQYDTAVVYYPNGEVKTYEIKAWNDFDSCDGVQFVTTDGEVIYTHLSNVFLCGKR